MAKLKHKKNHKKISKFVYWTPRILSILFILFLALFSLDIFDMKLGFWSTIVGLIMYNIPVFILAALLWVSWKHELIGAVAFILAGLFYIFMLLRTILTNEPHEWYMLTWSITIAGPAFLVGILFLLNWRIRKNNQKL
jgi:hypothetical protein